MTSHVVAHHIPRSIAEAFGATKFLALAKPSRSIQLIMIKEVLYRLVSRTLCL